MQFVMDCLDINEKGNLQMGGCDLVEVAEQFGTPCYVFDEEVIRNNCRAYKKSIDEYYGGNGLPLYASKAFSCKYAYKIAAEEASMEKYVLKIDDKTIKVEKGTESYEKTVDVAPFIYGSSGTTLIPLRGLLEEMGASVSWNGEEERITLSTENGDIRMRIQDPLVYVDDSLYGEVRYTLTVAPKIRDSRTFIPLRFVSEQLGYTVSWNGETKEITITK